MCRYVGGGGGGGAVKANTSGKDDQHAFSLYHSKQTTFLRNNTCWPQGRVSKAALRQYSGGRPRMLPASAARFSAERLR